MAYFAVAAPSAAAAASAAAVPFFAAVAFFVAVACLNYDLDFFSFLLRDYFR